jgi:hypothetical protein
MAKKKTTANQTLPPLPAPIATMPSNEATPAAQEDPAKSPLKSKTFWTGALVSLLGFLGFIQAVPAVADNPMLSSLLLMAAGIVMIVLRLVTRQAVVPVFNIPHMGGGRRPVPQPQPWRPNPQPSVDEAGESWRDWQNAR